MPADITSLTEGWLELESDPGNYALAQVVQLEKNFVSFV